MAYIGNPITQTAFITDTFSGTGSQTAFTMSVAPAGTTSMLVAVSGVLQDPSTYAVTGLTLNFTAAPPSGTGNISVRYLGVPATGVTNQAYRTVTEFTATAGQTTFTPPAYTVNYIDVYRNGVRLGTADYTATSGTSVVLAAGCIAGDLVTVESFYIASVLNAISNTAGSVTAYNLGTGIVGASNLNTTGTASTSTFLRGDMAWATAGLSWQSVQTTGFTAVAGRAYPCNTTSGAFTVTLPASATLGDQVALVDYAATFATYSLTINPNGSKINGSTANALLSTNYTSVIIVYLDSTRGWTTLSSSAATPGNPLPTTYTASYLIVAGGGGSGGGSNSGANGTAGGGAGGLLSGTTTLTIGTVYTAVVGAGGTAGTGSPSGGIGGSGGNSSFTGITSAVGGGGGGGSGPTAVINGSPGGSGGGAGSYSTLGSAGSGTPGQGNAGGTTTSTSPNYTGGGGGGSGSIGSNGSGSIAGSGGTGTASSITGTPVTYAGGGGGGTYNGGTAGTGGTNGGPAGSPGGGGNGSTTTTVTAGTANTGGGGGGSGGPAPSGSSTGATGGSGVVILSVPTVSYSGITTGSPTITTSGSNTIIKWTSVGSGTYTA